MINGDNVKQSIEVVVGEVDQLIGSARAGVGACMIFLRNMWLNSIHKETKSLLYLLVLTLHKNTQQYTPGHTQSCMDQYTNTHKTLLSNLSMGQYLFNKMYTYLYHLSMSDL